MLVQQLMLSFDGSTAPREILDAVRRGDIASFCLFKHYNVHSPAQLRQLTTALHAAAAEGGYPPVLMGIDQEGGQLVAIAEGATELPGNMAVGATRSEDLAEQAGYVLGRELLAMGINLNFAPSLDVNINPNNPVIGIRSFGDDPELVAQLGAAQIRGMQKQGLVATAKHFPGHGDTEMDSHHAVPVIMHTMTRMNTVELAPFRAAIEAKVGAVMSAHILFNTLDDTTPATLSPIILSGLLRNEMGFEGLIITDAMDMHAVARHGAVKSIRAALAAGADLVLLAHLPDQLALAQKLQGETNVDSLRRIQRARENLPRTLPSLDVVGCKEHQQIAQTIANRSITLVRDEGRALPLRPEPEDEIAVITVRPTDLTPADTSSSVKIALAEAVRKRHPRVRALELSYGAEVASEDFYTVLETAATSKYVIVGTINASQDEAQAALIRALQVRGQHPIVIAMRTPYDLIAFPEVETYLCSYSIRRVATEAIAAVLFGEIQPQGILPCAIPGLAVS